MALVHLNCPNCKAALEVDNGLEVATCLYCDSQFLLKRPAAYPSSPPAQATPYAPAAPIPRKKKRVGSTIAIIIGLLFLAVFVSDALDDENTNGPTEDRVITSQEFISAAQKAGYTMIIEDDYDGFGTYWAGAHKFAEGVVQKEGNEIYVIDYTHDKTVHNSKIEYGLYVDEVKKIDGYSKSDSGSNYAFQANAGDARVGIAYRIGEVNLYVVADAEYREEILAFFDAIGFGVEMPQ